jgi:hypothetical protein
MHSSMVLQYLPITYQVIVKLTDKGWINLSEILQDHIEQGLLI